MQVGQWVRCGNNIVVVSEILLDKKKIYWYDSINEKRCGWFEFQDIKKQSMIISNTPTELVQVGDLVSVPREFKGIREINNIDDDFIGLDYDNDCHITQITEIWTKTSDNTYTRQWKKE